MSKIPTTLDDFKLLLINRYVDLEFIDENSNDLKCKKCGDLSFSPFLTNCKHVLCIECGEKIRQRSGTRCPVSETPITHVDKEPKKLDKKINKLKMKCIEHKSGCKYKDELQNIWKHLKYCDNFNSTGSSNKTNEQVEADTIRKIFREDEFEFAGDNIDFNSDNKNETVADYDYSSGDDKIKNLREQNKGKLKKELNVLLLGQTGVGKSTFVNAFANYLMYKDIKSAMTSELKLCIPCKFTIWNDQFQPNSLICGTEDAINENMNESDQSCTQRCKKYEFDYNNTLIRIFDTPGVGDTRGMHIERINVDNILHVLSDYEYLHCICILLKPNEARLTAAFKYCIQQLLSQLPKSASNNIVFVFTHSRGTFYQPGDTVNPLTAILKHVEDNPPYVKIPFNQNNIFCLDNEAFRFLLALEKNIEFSKKQKEDYAESWTRSGNGCKRLIKYIEEGVESNRMTPHKITETLGVHHARRAVSELAKPLSDIAVNFQDNLKALNHQVEKIEKVKGNLNELQKLLHIPSIQIKVMKLRKPQTVCGSPKCVKAYKVGTLTQYHYPQICHESCFLEKRLTEKIPKEVIGGEKLRYCAAIRSGTGYCRYCECHYSRHMQIDYKTKVVEVREEDENIKMLIKTDQDYLEIKEEIVKILKLKETEYKTEEKKLTQYTAKFAIFLKQNAIIPYNDAFEGYLNQMVENEKSQLESNSSKSGLEQMIENYQHEKEALENTLDEDQKAEIITADEIMTIIEELKQMQLIEKIFLLDGNDQNKIKQESDDNQSDDEKDENDKFEKKDFKKSKGNNKGFVWKNLLNFSLAKKFK